MSGTSTVTAYDSKTLQPRFQTDIRTAAILQMEATGNVLLIGDYDHYDVKTKKTSERAMLAIDANTGKMLWQKSASQLNCYQEPLRRYQVDEDTVYFDCSRYPDSLGGKEDSRIMALSTQTGAIGWQTQPSTHRLMHDFPAAMTDRQYLTFRRVAKANTSQTQAVALDRQTGKLLWAFPLFDGEKYVESFRSIVAADGDRFFTLDELPRWQLWLLQMNINWYVPQPIAN